MAVQEYENQASAKCIWLLLKKSSTHAQIITRVRSTSVTKKNTYEWTFRVNFEKNS